MTSNSNSMIAAILGLKREQQVSDFCRSVINSIEKDILPCYFGFATLPRKTLTGYVVEILGPFCANWNDAQIMKIAMEDPNGLQTLLKPGDICIVDRGFRDVASYLEERGYRVLMPALKGKRNQAFRSSFVDSRNHSAGIVVRHCTYIYLCILF